MKISVKSDVPRKYDQARFIQILERIERAMNILPAFYSGSGSPESVITATPGSFYVDVDGGASVTLYVKESGTGNTGWIAK